MHVTRMIVTVTHDSNSCVHTLYLLVELHDLLEMQVEGGECGSVTRLQALQALYHPDLTYVCLGE
jgi:hypothetical protein